MIEPMGAGLINDTYRVATVSSDTDDYVLQRINHSIFKDVDLLQRNVVNVTEHIRKKLQERGETDIKRKALRFIPAKDGKMYYFDGVSVAVRRQRKAPSPRWIFLFMGSGSAIRTAMIFP